MFSLIQHVSGAIKIRKSLLEVGNRKSEIGNYTDNEVVLCPSTKY